MKREKNQKECMCAMQSIHLGQMSAEVKIMLE
jgi:hypothetical protein